MINYINHTVITDRHFLIQLIAHKLKQKVQINSTKKQKCYYAAQTASNCKPAKSLNEIKK